MDPYQTSKGRPHILYSTILFFFFFFLFLTSKKDVYIKSYPMQIAQSSPKNYKEKKKSKEEIKYKQEEN